MLASAGRPQVSMNLVDLDRTGIEAACLEVRRLARSEGTDVDSVELVGLVPRRDLDRCSDEFLRGPGSTRAARGRGPDRATARCRLPGEDSLRLGLAGEAAAHSARWRRIRRRSRSDMPPQIPNFSP